MKNLRRAFVGSGLSRRMGFINSEGELVIAASYISGFDFRCGLGSVLDPDTRLMGSIDNFGEYVIHPTFTKLLAPSGRIHRCWSGSRMGYVATDGSMIALGMIVDGRDFSEGIASIRRSIGGCVSIVDQAGVTIIESDAPNMFIASEGKMPFRDSRRGCFGFIDTAGSICVEPIFEFAHSFSDGRAAVSLRRTKEGKCDEGYIDSRGKFSCIEGATDCHPFSGGLACFGTKRGLMGFIDSSLAVAIPPAFEYAGCFVCGLAPAKNRGGKYGYISSSGQWAIAPDYDSADEFYGDLAEVRLGCERLYLSLKGHILWREPLE